MFKNKNIATSTPIRFESTVLKEKQWNKIEKTTTMQMQPPLKPILKPILKKSAKANLSASFKKLSMHSSKTKENGNKSMAQRQLDYIERKQKENYDRAMEATRISEQRRLRLSADVEVDVKELSMSDDPIIKVSPAEEKKRLELKLMKQKVIMQVLAEQEARKKGQLRKNEVTKTPKKTFPSTPRRPPSFRVPGMRRFDRSFPKKHVKFNLPVEDEEKKMKKKEEALKKEEPTAKADEAAAEIVEPKVKAKSMAIIRYTKDELRYLNPFGYFYM